MATPSGSEGLPPDRPFPFPGVQDYLLEGTAVYIGTLTARTAAEALTTAQVVAIGVFEGQLLVCLPQTAWHRLSARRLLAPGSLKKGVHCEVVASSSEDPAQAHAAYRLKVWLGLLSDPLVGSISYEEGDEPACCFKSFGPLSAVAMVPFGPALASIARCRRASIYCCLGELASRSFRFSTSRRRRWRSEREGRSSGSGPDGGWSGSTSWDSGGPASTPGRPGHDRGRGSRKEALSCAAEGEASRCSRRVRGRRRGCFARRGFDPERKILAGMQKDRERSNDLEQLLDRADGAGGAKEQVGLGPLAPKQRPTKSCGCCCAMPRSRFPPPRQEGTACSARGWIEHRSHLQQYAGPIRSAWLLGGIVDAINAGSPEQAKSMALLDIASLDQASIDVQSV